mmetsp:Transcript_45264/g.98421  ORF Transcript_45264/g.98421 Transcript_45264/m.98421 type:complete len:1566 (+) Transcript_45264:83-4780(+)
MAVGALRSALVALAFGLGICSDVVISSTQLTAGQSHWLFVSSVNAPQTVELRRNQTVVATASASVSSPSLYELAVPSDASGTYTIRATWGSDAEANSSSIEVEIIEAVGLVILEHDKPLYKPGTTAQFRAIVVSPGSVTPLPNQQVQFWVRSPKGHKLMQEVITADTWGVARFEFPIADEPVLGQHTAQASIVDGTTSGQSHEVNFRVEEYNLPRFSVSVSPSLTYLQRPADDSLVETVEVRGIVFAEYTFKEAVLGTANISLFSEMQMPWLGVSRLADSSPSGGSGGSLYKSVAMTTVQLSGQPMDFVLKLSTADIPRYGVNSLMLEATVEDAATGERRNGTANLPVATSPHGLEADIEANMEAFKPGLPVKLRVVLTHPDGTAASHADAAGSLKLEVRKNTVDYQQASTVELDLPGSAFVGSVAEVEIPVETEASSCCDPLANAASYDEYARLMACCTTSMRITLKDDSQSLTNRKGESSELCLSRAYSPSGHFLDVVFSDDDFSQVKLISTRALTGAVLDFVLLQGSAVVGGRRNVAVSNVVEATADVKYSTGDFSVVIPSSLSGECRLVAMLSWSDGSVLTGAVKFERSFQRPFELMASFGEATVLPGGSVELRLSGPAGARAFVAAVDQSVELMGTRASIAGPSVLAGLKRAAGDAPTVAPRVWRHCPALGPLASLTGDLGAVSAALLQADVSAPKLPGETDLPYGESLGPGCPRHVVQYSECGNGDGVDMMLEMAFAAEGPAMNADGAEVQRSNEKSQGEGLTKVGTVRSFFPETWIWKEYSLSGQGQAGSASEVLSAPDTITSWSLEAWAVNADGLASTRASEPLTVFKPLFVEMRLPVTVVRGEEFELIVAIFNYIPDGSRVEATLKIALAEGFQLPDNGTTYEQQLLVARGSSNSTTLRVRALTIGALEIQASAQTPQSVGHADAMKRNLIVKAEGLPEAETLNKLLIIKDGKIVDGSMQIAVPDFAVDGSVRASVMAVGDLMGPSLKGLERLLQIPSGCGEQNMITLAPNVYVSKYLLSVDRMSPEIRQRITRNMLVGYGRQLTYRHSDGSFSAFGESDGEGSTWLTAFVVRTFAEIGASGMIIVDEDVLRTAGEWLKGLQDSDGSFRSLGTVIHQEMMGGISGGSGQHGGGFMAPPMKGEEEAEVTVPDSRSEVQKASLTSFVVLALAELVEIFPDTFSDSLDRARSYLQGVDVSSQPYTAVLMNYALLSSGHLSAEAASTAVLAFSTQDDDGARWWSSSSASLQVELTGYAVLVLSQSSSHAGEAFEGVRWLIAQRKASGGFHSTQDTVVALSALSTFAATLADAAEMSVSIVGEELDHTFVIEKSNFDVVQSIDVTPGTNISFQARMSGSESTGTALLTTELRYNVLASPVNPCFKLDVEWFYLGGASAETAQQGSVRACTSPLDSCNRPGGGGMAMMSVSLFSGWMASTESLQDLKTARLIKRFEIDAGQVQLYLDAIPDNADTCLEFNVAREFLILGTMPVRNQVFEYYAREYSASAVVSFESLRIYEPASSSPLPSTSSTVNGSSVAMSVGTYPGFATISALFVAACWM